MISIQDSYLNLLIWKHNLNVINVNMFLRNNYNTYKNKMNFVHIVHKIFYVRICNVNCVYKIVYYLQFMEKEFKMKIPDLYLNHLMVCIILNVNFVIKIFKIHQTH
jgi:hypothetical protein